MIKVIKPGNGLLLTASVKVGRRAWDMAAMLTAVLCSVCFVGWARVPSDSHCKFGYMHACVQLHNVNCCTATGILVLQAACLLVQAV
jgi:hypothetical protein